MHFRRVFPLGKNQKMFILDFDYFSDMDRIWLTKVEEHKETAGSSFEARPTVPESTIRGDPDE
jgi:hypothetical protein